MICQDCGVEAQTKYVSFHQNIGALVIRFPSSIEGHLCKSCIHKHFWGMTGITLFLGWWGVISFIVTPFFLLNNIGRYLFCLGMAPTPPGAKAPQLTDAAIEQIQPHLAELFGRLNAGEDFAAVASSIAEQAGVTPGQVALFVHAVVRSQEHG
jgi:hypothetical protein